MISAGVSGGARPEAAGAPGAPAALLLQEALASASGVGAAVAVGRGRPAPHLAALPLRTARPSPAKSATSRIYTNICIVVASLLLHT